MKSEALSEKFSQIITFIIYFVTGTTLFAFSNLTTEFYEIPKIIILISLTLIMLTLWAFTWVVRGKLVITRTPLDLSLLALFVAVVVSTSLSDSRYVSIIGNFPRVHGSAITWATYIIFYFILVSNLKALNHIKVLLTILIFGGAAISLISLLSYFNVFLPLDFAKLSSFTPTGSSFSTTAVLALLLPFTLLSIAKPGKYLPLPVAVIFSTLFAITIALTGGMATITTALLAIIFSTIIGWRTSLKKHLALFLIPVVISSLLFGLSFVNSAQNPLKKFKDNFLYEPQLGFSESWKVSASAFRDAPFFGTGPSTYLFNFTQYKPVEFNAKENKFWNVRFDTAFNEYLQILGTLGSIGFIALLFFSVTTLSLAWRGLKKNDDSFVLPLSISVILSILLLALHVTTPVTMVVTLLLIASLMALYKNNGHKVEELVIGFKATVKEGNLISIDALPILILFAIVSISSIVGLIFVGRAAMADYYNRKAIQALNKPGLDAYNYLIKAVNTNNYVDTYRKNLAQTNFLVANAIAASKGPTEASPTGSLTDQDKQNIQTFLGQSIEQARVATALSPRSAENYEILGSIYRQISGVAQNALQFSLDSYGKAITRDPLNPVLRINVGGIYYSVRNYDLAVRFFTDAVNLKPDYPNAWYNLSIALKDKGDLQGAQLAAERVVSLVDQNSQDYQTASSFLADLKARIATGSAQESQVTPPAAQNNGALQQQDLPKVLDLPKPTNISTPSAVPSPAASSAPSIR